MTEGSLTPNRSGLRALCTVLLVAALSPAAGAQGQDYRPNASLPLGSYFLNLPTPRTLPARTWEVRFTHRFSQPINEGDENSLWGLDSSADIGIGVAWSPRRDLDLEVFRSDIEDNWELSGKFAVLKQAPSFPVSITARAGADVRTEPGIEDDRVSPFAQVIVSRRMNARFELFAIPTYAANSGPFDHAFNVPLGVAWQFRPYLSLIAEVVPENNDVPGGDGGTGWAIGLKRAIGGHFFEIVLTDSRATHVGQYMAGDFLGGLDTGDVHLGFNIVRRF